MKYLCLPILLWVSCFSLSFAARAKAVEVETVESVESTIAVVDSLYENDSVDEVTDIDMNLDSLLHVFKFKSVATGDCKSDSIGHVLSDSVYMRRLSQIPAIMELAYNDIVKRFIELYTVRKRKQVEYMLGAGKYYFPIFEQSLDAAGLPIELKYLPVIESALNPRAFSRAGASGLWQFMYSTGKIYGLEGNSLIDERRDPIKATNAAVRYLKDLYGIYNDWALVIAAYNCGPGNVNKAIKRSGGKRDYWGIYPYLPKETRGYVPAFIAATYTMTYYKEHNFCPQAIDMPITCDTLVVSDRLHFVQISEVLGVDMCELEALNPQYRQQILPGNGVPYTLCLPQKYVNSFIENKDSIVAYKADSLNTNRIVVVPAAHDPYYGRVRGGAKGAKGAKAPVRNARPSASGYYVVRPGDTLSSIARRHGINVATLKRLNNLRSDRINQGQQLRVR